MYLIYYNGTFHIPTNNCWQQQTQTEYSLTCYFTLYAEIILIKVARLWNTWKNKIYGLHTKWS